LSYGRGASGLAGGGWPEAGGAVLLSGRTGGGTSLLCGVAGVELVSLCGACRDWLGMATVSSDVDEQAISDADAAQNESRMRVFM
jgi:hypothetical protein